MPESSETALSRWATSSVNLTGIASVNGTTLGVYSNVEKKQQKVLTRRIRLLYGSIQ